MRQSFHHAGSKGPSGQNSIILPDTKITAIRKTVRICVNEMPPLKISAPPKMKSILERRMAIASIGQVLDKLPDAGLELHCPAVLKINRSREGALYGRRLAKQKKGDSAGGDADFAAAKAIDEKLRKRLQATA
jgi:hypothetical protein